MSSKSLFWDITPYSPIEVNRISEQHVESTFKVEEYAKQNPNMKQAASIHLLASFSKKKLQLQSG
jgi:hypothetical protein